MHSAEPNARQHHKKNVCIHTLRHSYATHLLERPASTCAAFSNSSGHARLETAMVYLHLTNKGQQDAWEKINDLMKECCKMQTLTKSSHLRPPIYFGQL